MTQPPCNGCVRCCRGDAIRLLPGDNPALYKTVAHQNIPGALMLDHKPNGDCIYLVPGGCSIHDHSPTMCKTMDCRNVASRISYTQARKMQKTGQLHFGVWRKGRDLLKQTGLTKLECE